MPAMHDKLLSNLAGFRVEIAKLDSAFRTWRPELFLTVSPVTLLSSQELPAIRDRSPQ
jgi:hypothetical protein